jgi:hypothetical protein
MSEKGEVLGNISGKGDVLGEDIREGRCAKEICQERERCQRGRCQRREKSYREEVREERAMCSGKRSRKGDVLGEDVREGKGAKGGCQGRERC